MTTSSTTKHLSDRLYLACGQCIECLGKLRNIHLEIDPPTRTIAPNDPEYVYHMRKVLLHVEAIVGWQLDMTAVHVMAPEMRAAIEQVDIIWGKAVHEMDLEGLNEPAKLLAQGNKRNREFLSSYVHPTPQRLLTSWECGGLGPAGERCYAPMAVVLVDLVFRHAILLAYLAQLLGSDKEQDIISVLKSFNNACTTIVSANSSDMP